MRRFLFLIHWVCFGALFTYAASGSPLKTYSQLFTLDAEQTLRELQPYLKKVRNQGGKAAAIKAVQLILAHPQAQRFRERLLNEVRSALANDEVMTETLIEVAKESESELKKRALTKENWLTHATLLNNLIIEVAPYRQTEPRFQKLLEQLKAAQIELPSSLKAEIKREQMRELPSPSEVAKRLLLSQ